MTGADSFGGWLRLQRRAADLTRLELARRAYCSASTVRRVEADELRPSKALAKSLAAALAVPAERREAFVRFARGESRAFAESASVQPGAVPARALNSNLPSPLNSFVGRKRELRAVCELMRDSGVRLLTLSGPPGTGKTRLSIEAARQLAGDYAGGAHFIPLAPISDSSLAASAIAQALGVREEKMGAVAALHAWLRERQVLLVLDNFEQVLAAGPLVTALLAGAPRLKVLVTSRALLDVYGEHEFPLPPLELPDVNHLPTGPVQNYYRRFPSLQLFRDRARAANADFRLTPANTVEVARICAWLDGLPLAIEMAAAHVKWLPPGKVLEQLSDRLEALTGGPRDLSPRQQSLRGAIDWSYNLLSRDEKRLFDLLGVFSGGWDEKAIVDLRFLIFDGENDAGAERTLPIVLIGLVEKSLVRDTSVAEGGARYDMLETIRDYARERLRQSGQIERVRKAHAEYFYRVAQAAYPHLVTGGEQRAWLDRLECEHNNLRAALDWATADAARSEFALRLVRALSQFWLMRGYFGEWQRRMDDALALDPTPSEARARVLNEAGTRARQQGEYAPARQYQTQALEIYSQLGDEAGICRSQENLAVLAGSEGDYVRADELLVQVLPVRRRLGDSAALLPMLNNLAIVKMRLGDYAQADALYRECVDLCRLLDNLKAMAHPLYGQAQVRVLLKDYAGALSLHRESLSIRRQLADRTAMPRSIGAIGNTLLRMGEAEEAARLISAATKLEDELGLARAPTSVRELDESVAQLRAALGADAFAQSWSMGQTLSLDEATEQALR
jgi:non-specific serine/threonine protein kinase